MIKHQDVERLLRNHIKRTADSEYFYKTLNSPDWIDPLHKVGVFNELPEPVLDGDYISYPSWPEGQFLLRMAQSTIDEATLELIATIIVNISDSRNQHAEAVRVQVATALPAENALRFVKQLQRRFSGEDYIGLYWADATVSLALHVAKAGHVNPALHLLKSLLRVFPDPRSKEEMPLGIPESRLVIDRWLYAQLIEEKLPAFVEVCGAFKVLEVVLCPLLDRAGGLNVDDFDNKLDYSLIWRPIIQESEIHDTSPRHLLTTAIVVTAVQAAQRKPQCISKLVELLEEREPPRTIFIRVVLHLLAQAPEECHSLIANRLSSLEIMSDIELWTEYGELLGRRFPNLLPEQQDKIVKRILAGPRLEMKEPDTQMSIKKDKWTLMRLHLISEHLPREAARRYQDLRSNYPDLESLRRSFPPHIVESWTGPTSPLSPDEMGQLGPREVIAFLKGWIPEGNWNSPTPEGLSRILSIAVEKNAADYANEALSFSDLEPTYVKALFYGLTETDQKFPWGPVLQLSRWVVDQSRDYNLADQSMNDGPSFDRDPDWGRTRKSIAHLLKSGLKSYQSQIPHDYQEDVWHICVNLLCDPDPALEYERRYGRDLFGFADMALNTVRGTTMHVVMAFVKWSYSNSHEGADPNNERGAPSMPSRVRKLLEAHLLIEFDPSLSVRAVYGEWFTRLYQIDRKWAGSIIPLLFPLEKDTQEYFLAAWHSYCLVSRIDIELFELLSDRYRYAIELLPSVRRDRMRSEYKMARQLAKLFAREEASLVKIMIDKFFQCADDQLRSYMVTCMAVNPPDYERKPITPYAHRLKRFWDQRLAMLEKSESPNDSQSELEAYGKWFLLDYLPPNWTLEHLLRTLKLAGKVADLPTVCKKLADLSHDYPKEVTECIKCLAERGNEWFLARTNDCRNVLSRVIGSGNEEARESAKEVVNHLVARGFSDYKSITAGSD